MHNSWTSHDLRRHGAQLRGETAFLLPAIENHDSPTASGPSITDDRGRLIRSISRTRTLLSAAPRDELVALPGEGSCTAEVSWEFGIFTWTAAAHLVRRSVPQRQRGLADVDAPKAVRLYESGLTLAEVGLRFSVSRQEAGNAVAAEGVETRPRGRRPRPAARSAGDSDGVLMGPRAAAGLRDT